MSGVFTLWRGELRRMFALKPVRSVLIGAALLYAVFYPQPYLNEALRDVPVVLVDLDRSTASRDFARRTEVTEGVTLVLTAADLATAERQVLARAAYGILVIPRDFERDLLHGRPAPVALYADASYFLLYQRISGAVTSVARAMGAEVETTRLIASGTDPAVASIAADPLAVISVPLFNPQAGYATYLLPAAFVLILQQLLLIGIGLLGTLPGHAVGGAVSRVFGKLLASLTLQTVVLPAYLIGLPYLYGVPRLGALWPFFAVAVPFVLAVSALAMILAALCRTPIRVQLATATLGLPFFFIAGFSWPGEAMPPTLRLLADLVPSTTAIDAFVAVNQMGAPLADIQPQLYRLWGLAVAYILLALVAARLTPERTSAPPR